MIPVACRETDVEHGPVRDPYDAKVCMSMMDDIGCAQGRRAMNPGTHDSVYDEAVVAWLDNATEHARANAQAKLLYCLECVSNELIEMKREAGLATRPWSRKD